MRSYNNNLILKPYTGARKVEANTNSGFATIKQKTTLIGLEALADCVVVGHGGIQMQVETGQTVYFPEEILYASDWSKKKYTSDAIEGEFIIAPGNYVVLVK